MHLGYEDVIVRHREGDQLLRPGRLISAPRCPYARRPCVMQHTRAQMGTTGGFLRSPCTYQGTVTPLLQVPCQHYNRDKTIGRQVLRQHLKAKGENHQGIVW